MPVGVEGWNVGGMSFVRSYMHFGWRHGGMLGLAKLWRVTAASLFFSSDEKVPPFTLPGAAREDIMWAPET